MGALAGSISTTAYYVEGKLESGFRETFLAGMQKFLFEDISVESEDTESWGWVNIHDPFDTDLRIDNVHWDAYFLFGLRQDVLRVPASLFKLYLKQRFDAYKAEFGKERLAKSEKDNMKDLEDAFGDLCFPASARVRLLDGREQLVGQMSPGVRVWAFDDVEDAADKEVAVAALDNGPRGAATVDGRVGLRRRRRRVRARLARCQPSVCEHGELPVRHGR